MHKACFILNYAPHYRKAIFEKLSKELHSDIYCGDKIRFNIKKIDFDAIDFPVNELKTLWLFNRFAWMKGQIGLLFHKEYKNYVITGQHFFLSDTVFMLLCFFSKKKVFLWNHGPNGKEGAFKKIYYKILFSLIDGMFIYSNRGKNILVQQYGVKSEKLHVIYNSLDYNHHLEMREASIDSQYYESRKYFKNPSLPVLVFIGRLTAVKKIDLLVDAVKDLKQKGFDCNLMLIGDGAEKSKLEEKANDIKDNVHFLGSSYDELENAKLLANAALCVSPGNVGLTAIHSLSFGTPVCTHDDFANQMPEVEAIEPGKTGIYYNPAKNNLAQVVQNWFESDLNRNDIRNNCYEKIDRFFNPDYQIEVFRNALTK